MIKKLVPIVLLAACAEPKVENTGPQSQVSGLTASGSGATKVQSYVPSSNGTLQPLSEADVAADGKFTISVGNTREKIILQAEDASGNVKGAVILDSARGQAKANETTAPPFSVESAIEADVLVALLKMGQAIGEINTVDLRLRVDAKLAAALNAHASKADRVKTVAEAVQVAQKTEVKAYADKGVSVTSQDLFNAQLPAAEKLNVALQANDATAYEVFYADLDTLMEQKGLKGPQKVRGQQSVSVAFRASVKVRIAAGDDTVVQAAQVTGAQLEARAMALGTVALLQAGGGGQAAIDLATTAGATLRTEVAASADAAACGAAFTKFAVAIRGTDAPNSSTVVGLALNTEGVVNGVNAMKVSVDAVIGAAKVLDGALNVLVSASGAIDFNAAGSTVIGAYVGFNTATNGQLINFIGFGNKAQLGADLLMVADGSFRLRS